jgi:hypothetical protein
MSAPRKRRVAWPLGTQEEYRDAIFSNDGSKITCKICPALPSGNRRELTPNHRYSPVPRWKDHVNSMAHQNALSATSSTLKQTTLMAAFALPNSITKHHTSTAPIAPAASPAAFPSQVAALPVPQRSRISCEGVIPDPTNRKTMGRTEIYQKYTFIDPSKSTYCFGVVSCATAVPTIFTTACNDNGQNRQKGRACISCYDFRKKKWRDLKKIMEKAANKFASALDSLQQPVLCDLTVRSLMALQATAPRYLSDAGNVLRQKCDATLAFYNRSTKLKAESSGAIGGRDFLSSPTSFLNDFEDLYRSKPSFRSDLVVLLLEALVAKAKGDGNVKYAPKLLNFYLAAHLSCPKTSEIMRANLPSPGSRYLRRLNSCARKDAFILCEKEHIIANFISILAMLKKRGVNHPSFSVSIDGTAVVKVREFSSAYNAILGGIHPNHFVTLPEGISKEDFEKLLFDDKTELASEVKVAVITVQSCTKGTRVSYALCARAQGKNEQSDFNNLVLDTLNEYCIANDSAVLLNSANDGVSCDSAFVRTSTHNFLAGETGWLGITDPNHNNKNFRYQVIGGSSVASIGKYVIDADMLRVAGVPLRRWKIEDLSSLSLVALLSF